MSMNDLYNEDQNALANKLHGLLDEIGREVSRECTPTVTAVNITRTVRGAVRATIHSVTSFQYYPHYDGPNDNHR